MPFPRSVHLTPRLEVDRKHIAIDHVLTILSLDQKGQPLEVISPGPQWMGSGTEGQKRKWNHIVQDENISKYYDLPRSSVAACFVDIVSPPRTSQDSPGLVSIPTSVFGDEKAEELLLQSDLEKIFGLLRRARELISRDYKPPHSRTNSETISF